MGNMPADFAALIADFLSRCGVAGDPGSGGIEFSADGYLARAMPHPGHDGRFVVEVEIGTLDPEFLAENAAALFALHQFNDALRAATDWTFIIDAEGTPLLRLVGSIAATDAGALERLLADGIETATAAALLANGAGKAEARTSTAAEDFGRLGLIRG